jgi:hypothetical protein
MRNVEQDYPDIDRTQLERIRDLMDAHVRDCLVTGYEYLIPTLHLPDEDDRHVLAAAICSGAEVIVTSNLKDFPEAELAKYGIKAQHPDDFISHLFGLSPDTVCAAARQQRLSLKNPPFQVDEFLATLERNGLAATVASLKECRALL